MTCQCFLQVSNKQGPTNNPSARSKHFQIRQGSGVQTLFPKPIYSYRYLCSTFFFFFLQQRWAVSWLLMLNSFLCGCSTLIFMALMNSKTGCLPVSEIYNFMTEHFPYFKVSHLITFDFSGMSLSNFLFCRKFSQRSIIRLHDLRYTPVFHLLMNQLSRYLQIWWLQFRLTFKTSWKTIRARESII